MIDCFKLGYWYKYIGKNTKMYWLDEKTKILCNRKWHKCMSNDKHHVRFEKIGANFFWSKKDFKYFQESKYHPVKKLLKEI